jgi:hypothetical protein
MTVNQARNKYRPDQVKVLFIAEAPPSANDRFFYFENVKDKDSLFLHLIRGIYQDVALWEVKKIRSNKEQLLLRFMEDGYFLDDAVNQPIPQGTSSSQKVKRIKENQDDLLARLNQYSDCKIVLLSSTVFNANYSFLSSRYTVVNRFPIPFPSSGQQSNFKREFQRISHVFNQ